MCTLLNCLPSYLSVGIQEDIEVLPDMEMKDPPGRMFDSDQPAVTSMSQLKKKLSSSPSANEMTRDAPQ